MKLHYFFGCILAVASLAVWPEIGLAHGGGGYAGGGGGHAFVGGDRHAFGGFTGRGFSPGFSGTRGFSTGRFSGRGHQGRFGDHGFRDHRVFFQQFAWPVYWYPSYPYDYSYLDYGPDNDYQYGDNSAAPVHRNPSDPPPTMAQLSSASTQTTPGPWIQGPILRTSIAATVRATQ